MFPIYDCFSHHYKKPFGAVREYQECIFKLRIPKTPAASDITLVMFRPGFKEKYTILEKAGEREIIQSRVDAESNEVSALAVSDKADDSALTTLPFIMGSMFGSVPQSTAAVTADAGTAVRKDDGKNRDLFGGMGSSSEHDRSAANEISLPTIDETISAVNPAATSPEDLAKLGLEITKLNFLSRLSSRTFSFRPLLTKKVSVDKGYKSVKGGKAGGEKAEEAPAPKTFSSTDGNIRGATGDMGDTPDFIRSEGAPHRYRPRYVAASYDLDDERDGAGYDTYLCYYTPQDVGVHYYYFTATISGQRKFIKRVGASIGEFTEHGEMFQLTVYGTDVKTPHWLKGGMMYQIFPDRFAKSENASLPPQPADRRFHPNWSDVPQWRPDAAGMIYNNDYFGGNLKGIEEKLSYLSEIGVTCIYLCPIFEAHENHRYNTACYERIDPTLGTESDFINLCSKAREKGIRVILDGVFSHTGADSVYFNKFGRYGDRTGAFRDPASPYRKWYCWLKYPSEYESWWGFSSLPNVNENNSAYTRYITGVDTQNKKVAGDGILQKWLTLGASGWRLDVADELPDEFIDNLNSGVKAVESDAVIYGEVWEDATNKESYGVRRRYLLGGQLDSVMNYPFKECILNYVKYGDAGGLVNGVMTIIHNYPKQSVDVLMNFVSTHDTERAITRLAGAPVADHDREWQASRQLSDMEYIYGVSLLKCAMVLQFFLPGIPCVYYGDEAGQEGYKDPFNRNTYPWGSENFELIEFTKKLSKIRGGSKVFVKGGLHFHEVTPDKCSFTRVDYDEGEAVTVYLNKSKNSVKFPLKPPVRGAEFVSCLCSPHISDSRSVVAVATYDFAAVKWRLNAV